MTASDKSKLDGTVTGITFPSNNGLRNGGTGTFNGNVSLWVD